MTEEKNTDASERPLDCVRLTAEELLPIEAKEYRQNKAFREWIGNNKCFFNLPQSKQDDLALYVEALNKEIADKDSLILLMQKELAMKSNRMNHPATLDQDQIMKLMGYETLGLAERKLRQQGIRPIYGRAGKWFVTLDMLNAARGVKIGTVESGDDQLCTDYGDATEAVEKFAVMVADKAIAEYKALGNFAVAEEREQCAIVCDKLADYWSHPGDEKRIEMAQQCAYEIRMRLNSKTGGHDGSTL